MDELKKTIIKSNPDAFIFGDIILNVPEFVTFSDTSYKDSVKKQDNKGKLYIPAELLAKHTFKVKINLKGFTVQQLLNHFQNSSNSLRVLLQAKIRSQYTDAQIEALVPDARKLSYTALELLTTKKPKAKKKALSEMSQEELAAELARIQAELMTRGTTEKTDEGKHND